MSFIVFHHQLKAGSFVYCESLIESQQELVNGILSGEIGKVSYIFPAGSGTPLDHLSIDEDTFERQSVIVSYKSEDELKYELFTVGGRESHKLEKLTHYIMRKLQYNEKEIMIYNINTSLISRDIRRKLRTLTFFNEMVERFTCEEFKSQFVQSFVEDITEGFSKEVIVNAK